MIYLSVIIGLKKIDFILNNISTTHDTCVPMLVYFCNAQTFYSCYFSVVTQLFIS